jgi:predicted transcriptional regulator
LVGVVSVTDILCHDLLPQKESGSHGPHDFYLHTLEEQFAVQDFESLHLETEPQITVQDVMTQKIFQVDHEDTIQAVAAHMIKNHIHRVFVTQKEKVVGIISAVDMLKIIRDL